MRCRYCYEPAFASEMCLPHYRDVWQKSAHYADRIPPAPTPEQADVLLAQRTTERPAVVISITSCISAEEAEARSERLLLRFRALDAVTAAYDEPPEAA